MKQNNLNAKKRFGQNFLKDQNVLNRIVNLVDLENQNVLEIGPGRGDLTKKLLQKANFVKAYEIDRDLVRFLNEEIKEEHFQLVPNDFLQEDISGLKNYWIIANIPYYITTEIIFKILENIQNFYGAILMVQKEVAERIEAKKNSSEYSKLSLTCQYYSTTKKEFIVKANSFIPAPKVDSAIISLTFNKNRVWNKEINNFFKLCFLQRRKKLSFSLKQKYSLEKIESSFEKLDLTTNTRIQELDLEKVLQLYNYLEDKEN
ncbi:16S rRNA (adenine(1518)-N(6)/adenine(1519)-N(6))-dimethyltransferase RsmA [Mycoplasmopsis alligatoris]|uniref:Ribosomal RNA small subunit methyltransferase A n=1 Tax=Mycoplasmopsis alligatoris A21JP2 TaxID=747682 RepID=D4XWG7_9BACT|nr:16S rRNA (adenine(1518)-N(6)/adenine(1519)-N(6))-dimethyltransferase RsmA [Mycoplasmopsis alligatoris]EFF41316.1 dimethyladenosine transferase [Mycoplasmopsis alligatoris A21JP2]